MDLIIDRIIQKMKRKKENVFFYGHRYSAMCAFHEFLGMV